MYRNRFGGEKLQSDGYHNGMSRRELDKYMFGYDFPIPAKGIYELNLIAEKITAERGEPMTYENIRRNGIEYGENTFGRNSVVETGESNLSIPFDDADPDMIVF